MSDWKSSNIVLLGKVTSVTDRNAGDAVKDNFFSWTCSEHWLILQGA